MVQQIQLLLLTASINSTSINNCFSCNTSLVFKRFRISYWICILIISRRIIRFISIIILLCSIKFYIGITSSKSSVLSVRVPLIFDTQEINGALFFKTRFILYLSLASASLTVIVPLTIYVSL